MNQTHGHLSADIDARNRAAMYARDAENDVERERRAAVQQTATEFQQMLWMKNLDHQHALELRDAERRAAMDLKKLELDAQAARLGGANGAVETGSAWPSKWVLGIIAASIPIILPLILRSLTRARRHSRFYHSRRRPPPYVGKRIKHWNGGRRSWRWKNW